MNQMGNMGMNDMNQMNNMGMNGMNQTSGMYEKQTAKIIPFRSIDIFENAVSAGTG